MNTDLIITNTVIRIDEHGRYCLNDLHRASEFAGDEAKKPGNWTRLNATKELIIELENNMLKSEHALEVVDKVGTYATEILALDYCHWISPKFRLVVYQAFLDSRRPPVVAPQPAPQIHPIEEIERASDLLDRLGVLDDRVRLIIQERAVNIIMGADTPLIAQHAGRPAVLAGTFSVEELKPELDVTESEWTRWRQHIGGAVARAIRKVDPGYAAMKQQKYVAGIVRNVNIHPIGWRDIALAAAQSFIDRHRVRENNIRN